jgi:hypothetical protein
LAPSPTTCGEALVGDGIEHDADDGLFVHREPDGDAREGKRVDEVRGAVERIHEPRGSLADLRELAVRRRDGFLPDERVRRELGLEHVEDEVLAFLIRRGHQIDGTLVLDIAFSVPRRLDLVPGGPCRALGGEEARVVVNVGHRCAVKCRAAELKKALEVARFLRVSSHRTARRSDDHDG